MKPNVVLFTNDFIASTLALCKRDYEILAGGGKEAFWGTINILEEIYVLPMHQINKPVQNSNTGLYQSVV